MGHKLLKPSERNRNRKFGATSLRINVSQVKILGASNTLMVMKKEENNNSQWCSKWWHRWRSCCHGERVPSSAGWECPKETRKWATSLECIGFFMTLISCYQFIYKALLNNKACCSSKEETMQKHRSDLMALQTQF